MGSHARGEPGPFSDVDLVRFLRSDGTELPGSGSYLIDSRLVVVSDVTPTQVQASFTEPDIAVETIQGLRSGRSLIDRYNKFSAIQQRAHEFQWDDAMQAKANRWASRQMVGWIEEVHKGLEGLRSGDIGRLLHARFGASWGLARVMCVQRGVLLSGDNALLKEVSTAVGDDSEWTRLSRLAFGIGSAGSAVSLHEAVLAGLQLYIVTAEMLKDVLQPQDAPPVLETSEQIKRSLAQQA
jgi:hypothetical protein